MGGKMPAGYWRDYRARNRQRLSAQQRARRAASARDRVDRIAEYARTAAKRAAERAAEQPLTPLFPDLHHGEVVSFWDVELLMDLRQERALAELEGRDPEEAAREYRARERSWFHHTAPLLEEVA